jgi:hypothetical protein
MDCAPASNESPPQDTLAQQFLQLLTAERERVREFLLHQRQRCQEVELRLSGHVEQLKSEAALVESLADDSAAAAETRAAPRDVEAAGAPLVRDWEAEKRRILAALELETGGKDAATPCELTQAAKGSVPRSAKHEHTEAKAEVQLTAGKPKPAETVAVERLLDQDAIILQEREKLRHLQDEWRERFRQAEVELSLERARIARRQADIEEKLRLMEERLEGSAEATSATSSKPSHGRWMAELGLNER